MKKATFQVLNCEDVSKSPDYLRAYETLSALCFIKTDVNKIYVESNSFENIMYAANLFGRFNILMICINAE